MYALLREVTKTVDDIKNQEHQKLSEQCCIIERFLSSDLLEYAGLDTLRVQLLDLYFNMTFHNKAYLLHFEHHSFQMLDL